MAPISASLSPLSASARRGIRLVLLLEVTVNAANGLVSVFAPALALQGRFSPRAVSWVTGALAEAGLA